MSAMRNLILVFLLAATLAGCGFHLQGSRPLPQALQKLHIVYPQPFDVVRPPLLKFLQAEAERRGGWVVMSGEKDATRLRILLLETDREVLSVSPETGKSLESLLTTAVEYELTRGGEVIVPMDRLVVYREIRFQRTQVISKEYEEEDAREEMQRELARLMYLRLEGKLAAVAQ